MRVEVMGVEWVGVLVEVSDIVSVEALGTEWVEVSVEVLGIVLIEWEPSGSRCWELGGLRCQ